MKLKTLVIALALVVPALASADDTTKKTTDATTKDTSKTKAAKLADADIKVVAHLHHVNLMEIDMGKLAQRSATQGVKRYGEMLVKDHQTADQDLVKLARTHGVATIPADKPETDADKAEMKTTMDATANLKKLKGAEFDREYLRMMVEGHDKELARADTAISTVANDDLKTMITNLKPTLQRHSDQAKDLQKGNAQADASKPSK